MLDTLGSMRGSIVTDWLNGESVPSNRVNDAINDAVDSLWKTLIQAALSVFMGGPVTLSIASAAERTTVVSIANPGASPAASDVAATDPALAAHTVRYAITYVTESGSETLASTEASHTTAIGKLTAVHFPPLTTGAIGWNLYASMLGGTSALVKQNDAPLDFANYFNEPSDAGFNSDPNGPLVPTENTTGDDIFYIRNIEVQATHGGFKPWDGADLNSALMRAAGWNLAAASTYQSYYWDLINQRQLEMRPAAGMALNPRYFYVKKPRRMRFDNSPLPFPNVPATEFIRSYALSRIFLSVFEFDAAKAWASIAESERELCSDALTTMARPKTSTIAQYPC